MWYQVQLGSEGAVIPLPAAGPEQSDAGGPQKFNFHFSKDQTGILFIHFFHKI